MSSDKKKASKTGEWKASAFALLAAGLVIAPLLKDQLHKQSMANNADDALVKILRATSHETLSRPWTATAEDRDMYIPYQDKGETCAIRVDRQTIESVVHNTAMNFGFMGVSISACYDVAAGQWKLAPQRVGGSGWKSDLDPALFMLRYKDALREALTGAIKDNLNPNRPYTIIPFKIDGKVCAIADSPSDSFLKCES